MGLQAEWNGNRFEVTPGRVTPLASLSATRSISVERNEDKEGEPATQTVAFDLQTVDLSYTVARSAAGEDPREVYGRWWGQIGVFAPLFIGGRRFMADLFMLKSANPSNVQLDVGGEWLSCDIERSFEEYAVDESGLKVDSREDAGALRPGIATAAPVQTAAFVGPTEAQRQGKMPTNPGM